MYTLQALWTQAREGCDVVNIIFNNGSYAILKGELANVGARNPGRKALDMLEINRPDLDWGALARGMGVPATRAPRPMNSMISWRAPLQRQARTSSRR